MEARGRVSIPTKIREILNVVYEGKIVLTCGFFEKNPHLLLFPLREWEAFEAQYPAQGMLDYDEHSFMARLRTIGSCEETRLDDHGRVVLPDFMRSYAGLDREASFVGMGKYLALFSPRVLDRVSADAEKNLSHVRESLTRKNQWESSGSTTSR